MENRVGVRVGVLSVFLLQANFSNPEYFFLDGGWLTDSELAPFSGGSWCLVSVGIGVLNKKGLFVLLGILC
ncbi:hypothetical protein BO82DRAFT_114787 [Aspergillus uvarum CBS 121591]|uniref:Uncharacterized protein n=1 Tax=Aspergillus uvarum CBS 121591 TaxID=1448315 RepID=A0A319CNA4_9EURO|nr:hypothetical protein BO82DRAFT_114787 [Aspergillus uvarum CBS 121591]PYH80193.1 hypothetical protein BO82DRAFT_114787 [Aspergillus uvarum CBS 121591]